MRTTDELHFPRVATLIKATGEVSSIGLHQGTPIAFDKKQQESGAFERVMVGGDVRVGMFRVADGSFDWPAGHVNETLEARTRRQVQERAA